MRQLCVGSLVGLVLSVVTCPCALAGEDKPHTGTIEVEVVYKDTGEPVESVFVIIATCDGGLVSAEAASEGRLSVDVGAEAPGDTYSVHIRNLPPDLHWENAKSSTFVAYVRGLLQEVAFSPGEDVAKVRFEVERGRRLHGRVRRKDGTPFAGGEVVVQQSGMGARRAFSLTDADGYFDMLGVVPAGRAEVIVFAPSSPSENVVYSAPLLRRSVTLTGEATPLDLEVQTISVTLAVDVLKPLWPFSTPVPEDRCVGQLWVGRAPVSEHDFPDMGVVIKEPLSERGARRTARHNVSLGEFPARTTLTIEVGFAGPHALSGMPWNLSSCSTTTVRLGTRSEAIRLRVYEPGARLSRAVWYGAGILVMAVLLTILVQGARKRRRASESRDQEPV